ncbi:hypothetical protein DPQ22_06305 [Candidatus Tokpelaia sp.]|nr:hypothetical protein DPQ22_06305 [Candidatus Tokpelaia sp.]
MAYAADILAKTAIVAAKCFEWPGNICFCGRSGDLPHSDQDPAARPEFSQKRRSRGMIKPGDQPWIQGGACGFVVTGCIINPAELYGAGLQAARRAANRVLPCYCGKMLYLTGRPG